MLLIQLSLFVSFSLLTRRWWWNNSALMQNLYIYLVCVDSAALKFYSCSSSYLSFICCSTCVCILFRSLTCSTSSSMSQYCCSDFPLLYLFLSFFRAIKQNVNKRKSVLCMSFQKNGSGKIISFVFLYFFF